VHGFALRSRPLPGRRRLLATIGPLAAVGTLATVAPLAAVGPRPVAVATAATTGDVAAGRLVAVPARQSRPPPLALPDLDGVTRTLEAHHGRVTVINFWATWCMPCVIEMPSLQQMRRRIGADRIAVLAVNYGEALPRVRDFVARMDLDFPVLIDAFHLARRDWRVTALPTSWVADRDGRLRFRVAGEVDWLDPGVFARLDDLARGRSEPSGSNRAG
jgi:thiol-disulfide isomerase/thioredoxin